MSGFLLDTNVISELMRDTPEPHVVAFLNEQQDFWLSAIVVHELALGVQLLPQGRRREQLRVLLEAMMDRYEDRIIGLGRTEAETAATLRAEAQRSGRTVHSEDALIAGTAKAHDLRVVTRNSRDFEGMDVEITNPWPQEAP